MKILSEILCTSDIVSEIFGLNTIKANDDSVIQKVISMTPNGLPPSKLTLEVEAIISLLRNKNSGEDLCNGTRLKIFKLMKDSICAKVMTC